MMCRFVIHTMLEIPESAKGHLENILYNIATNSLGSADRDVESFWPTERLGLFAPTITVDAEFTVGEGEGDIPSDEELHKRFGNHLLLNLITSGMFLEIEEGDEVAVWVKPDQGKTFYLSESAAKTT